MSKKFLKTFIRTTIVIVGLFAITIVGAGIRVLYSNNYKDALEKIYSNDKVKDRIGDIQSIGWLPAGSITDNREQIEINIYGTKSNGNCILIYEKNEEDKWEKINFYFNELK